MSQILPDVKLNALFIHCQIVLWVKVRNGVLNPLLVTG